MLECPRGRQRFFLDLCMTALGFRHRPTCVRYRFKSSILLMLSNYGSDPVTTCVRGYYSFFFSVVQRKGFVGRQLLFQLVEGLLLRGVPYPFGILFKQVESVWSFRQGSVGTSFAGSPCREIALRRGRLSVQVALFWP